jgi:hypothetical protein
MRRKIPEWAKLLFVIMSGVHMLICLIVRIDIIIGVPLSFGLSAVLTYWTTRKYYPPAPPPLPKKIRFERKPLFTHSQLKFHALLTNTVDRSRFFFLTNIELSKIVTELSKPDSKNLQQKSVNYLLYDSKFNTVIAAIDLIDSPHPFAYLQPKDTTKEKILNEAGIPLIVFNSETATSEELRTIIEREIRNKYL